MNKLDEKKYRKHYQMYLRRGLSPETATILATERQQKSVNLEWKGSGNKEQLLQEETPTQYDDER